MKHYNRATICSIVAVAGVVATAISTAYGTVKAMRALDEFEDAYYKPTKKEIIRVLAPHYIFPAVFGASTVICILGSNRINKRHAAALMSAYTMLDNSYKQYRETLIDLHGEEADREVTDAMAVRGCASYHQIHVDTPDRKLLWYDELSGNTFEAYEREIMDAEYHLNRNFVLRGYSPLNEFYQMLGLPETAFGEANGWSLSDGYQWIDFEHRKITRDDGGREIYAIDFVFAPDNDYLREWE